MTHLVRHVMAPEPRAARPDMSAADAAGLMAAHDIGFVPLVDEERRPVGVVSDRDLVVRVLAGRQDPTAAKLQDVATTRNLSTVSPDATLTEARERMVEGRVKRLLVVKEDKLVGVVSLGDLAQATASARSVGEAVAGSSIPRSPSGSNGRPVPTPARPPAS